MGELGATHFYVEDLSKSASEPRNPPKMVAQRAPNGAQKGAQETLGASKIHHHRSPKPPSKTTRVKTTSLHYNKKTKPQAQKEKLTAHRCAGVGLVG